jgi:hypothetical protein
MIKIFITNFVLQNKLLFVLQNKLLYIHVTGDTMPIPFLKAVQQKKNVEDGKAEGRASRGARGG